MFRYIITYMLYLNRDNATAIMLSRRNGMEDLIKQLWQRAVTERSKKISYFSKNEKIRLKHELDIIKQANATEQILSFIAQADEARKLDDFYVKGAANCSFLLYCVGATNINPFWTGSQFERFINPLMDGDPYYEIVFSNPFIFSFEEEDMLFSELILNQAIERGFIKKEQLENTYNHPLASRYQFVEGILFESNGNIIWQEQVIELLYRMGGFSYAEADLMRRDGAKGYPLNGKWFAPKREKFIKNAVYIGYDWDYADKYFHYIIEANMHAYLKAHIAAVVLGSN